jgi:RHS repeat-associated protein
LGNNREVVDSNGKVVQINNYYPFGTPFYDEVNTTNASFQPFKYNGKELDMMHGLNTYDYGARQYYAALPVWDRVDLLAEKNQNMTPYHFCHDNPINRIDPDGNDDYFNNNGTFLYSKGDGGTIYVMQNGSFVPFQSMNLSTKANMKIGARIVGHYARQVGIKYNMNGGTGHVGISTMHKQDKEGRVLAATSNDNIYLNVTSGKLDEFMYNFYNMESTLTHEKEHKENPGTTENRPDVHAQIALKEMSSKFFAKASKEYQESIINQFYGYIREARSNGIQDNVIMELLKQKNQILESLQHKK